MHNAISWETYINFLKQCLFNHVPYSNLQLGNPVLEFATDFNSRAEFFWSHGLISDSTYKLFTSACNYSRYVSEYYRSSLSPVCSKVYGQVTRETSRFVDTYDVTLDVCIPSVLSQAKFFSPPVSLPPPQTLIAFSPFKLIICEVTYEFLNFSCSKLVVRGLMYA